MPDSPIEKRVARSDFWRGDLLRVWQHFEHTRREFEAFARDRGYDRRAMVPPSVIEDLLTLSTGEDEPAVAAVKTVSIAPDRGLTSHWLPTRYLPAPRPSEEDRDTRSRDSDTADDEPVRICDPSAIQLPQHYLASWPELRNRLEPLLGFPAKTRRIDADRLVKQFSRGEVIQRLPYQEHKRTHDRIVLIRDQSRHCVPYRADQSLVEERLQSISVRNGLRILQGTVPFELEDCSRLRNQQPIRSKRSTREEWSSEPEPGSHVLILGDLGWLEDESDDTFGCDAQDAWRQACRRWAMQGCHVFALVPFRPERLPPTMARWVHAMAWQGNAVEEVPRSERDAAVTQLLTMAYPAQRIEPGLLRAIRVLCSDLRDASIEAAFWQDRRHSGARGDAIKNDRTDIRRELEAAFEAVEPQRIAQVLKLIRSFRIAMGYSILWQTELLNLAPWVRALIDPDGEDESMAIRTVGALLHQMEHGGRPGLQDRLATLSVQATEYALKDPNAGQALRTIRASVLPDEERHPFTRIDEVTPDPEKEVLAVRIGCEPARLQLQADGPWDPGRNLECANTQVVLPTNSHLIENHGITDRERAFWKSGTKPEWVSDYGTDEYGAWCEFQVPRYRGDGMVTQRLRWIPPGEFMMGSPESDAVQDHYEGPQHLVRLTTGYWLADTQVTQELWEAISGGENPSHFKGDTRPVEKVSWDDCQTWLGNLKEHHGSIEAFLPTEAQWEYACRAGTQTAYSFGDYPGELSKYAWYYENSKRETHPVKQLLPNTWGLYDMHGNVWEWCDDWKRDYELTPQTDPSGPVRGSYRVRRGGSCGSASGFCRSAFRSIDSPGDRDDNLGFRLALGSVGGAEPSEGASTPAAEPGVERARKGSAPAAPRPVRRDSFWKSGKKPEWVSDYGKDTHGLWCEFQVPRYGGNGMVTQRLRWIPPGEFMMGSPQSEEGRYGDEGPQHLVTFTQGFWMADTQTTQEFWMSIARNENPSEFIGESRPVERVSWKVCQTWLAKLNQHHKSLHASLPTESQWEYACRAGTQTAYCFGDDPRDLPKYAWFRENSNFETHAVKQLLPNAWGVYDMHGNVWEWCSDWSGPYTSLRKTDPKGHSKGKDRINRGGSWDSISGFCRSAIRYNGTPAYRGKSYGFRITLSSFGGAEPSEGAMTPAAEPGVERVSMGSALREYTFLRSLDLDGLSPRELRDGFAELDFGSLRSVRVVSDRASYQFDRISKPAWAVDFGSDEYGLYATFEVQPVERRETKKGRTKRRSAITSPVRQRLRWIPPGRFLMGSPEGEVGRDQDEIQHWVNITHGYWMFDTPCTQALWECVMGSNLSYFVDPERPVEQVSWDDVSQFVSRLHERLRQDLRFRLPTEAEWEYACRAGTTTATYAGDLEILGDANAPVLDAIAWYGGNSGHEYDLKQFVEVPWPGLHLSAVERQGTRKVGIKVPNAWGLSDMLGNVWEWCRDWKDDYAATEQTDPNGPALGLGRVVRGGSAINRAGLVRSGCRLPFPMGFRNVDLGFRLVSSAFDPNEGSS